MVEFLLFVLAWFAIGLMCNVPLLIDWWDGEDISYKDLQFAILLCALGPISVLFFFFYGLYFLIYHGFCCTKEWLEKLAANADKPLIRGRRSARVFRDLRGEFDE